MKRSFVFSALFILFLFSACSSGAQDRLKVALLLSGNLGDKGFNDLSYEGLKRGIHEYYIIGSVMEFPEEKDWENAFLEAARNYEYVICGSATFKLFLERYASDFPHVKFAIIDEIVEAPNVMSVIFAENEGAFLAGAAASMFTKSKVIGWIGGIENRSTHRFLAGYQQGAAFADPSVEVLYKFTGTFNDPAMGKTLAAQMYDDGADIIMQVAGATGLGVFEAASETEKYVIGADDDQYKLLPGQVLLSVIKRIDLASYYVISVFVKNSFKGGETLVLDILNGGIGITEVRIDKNINAKILKLRDEIIKSKK